MFRLLFIFMIFLASPMQAFAWGVIGHRAVAEIAETRLTPEAREEVRWLLATEGYKSLADVATWADDVRSLKVPRQPWHMVELPLDDSPYDPKVECKQNMCVVGAIETMEPVLADRTKPTAARMMALKYLVHLIGDVHQPLHTTRAGFETVTFRGKVQTLHKVWDTSMIHAHKNSSEALAVQIEASFKAKVPYKSPPAWALESRAIARDIIFPQLPMDRILPNDYADQNWHIVEERIHEAGWRLAVTLNKAFASGVSEVR